MPPKNLFVDLEAAEEDDQGNLISNSDDDDEDDDRYESDFVDDSEETALAPRRKRVVLEDSEYELDEDDYLLLADNARANRKSRVRRVESSDEEELSDEEGCPPTVPKALAQAPPTVPEALPNAQAPPTVPEALPKAQAPPTSVSDEELIDMLLKEERPAAPARRAPLPIFTSLDDDERPKPKRAATWADFKFQQAQPKGKAVAPKRSAPVGSGIMRTEEGMFLVTENGKRVRLTEDGNVKL